MKEQRPFNHPHPTPNIARPSQPHPNPAPGATKEAAAAAKQDAAKRDGGVIGALKAAYKKMTDSTPKPGNVQSAAALADRKDQTAKLKNE